MIPCVADSPDVELDFLSLFLDNAVSAFPLALKVGRNVVNMDPETVYDIRE